MEKRFREVTREIFPTNQIESEWQELLEFKRPPHVKPQEALDSFKDIAESIVDDIVESNQPISEFSALLTSNERDFLQISVNLQEARNGSVFGPFITELKKKLIKSQKNILVELEDQEELFRINKGSINKIFRTINTELSNVPGFSKFSIEDLSVIITQLPRRHSGRVAGGQMLGSGIIVINSESLKEQPRLLLPDLTHEVLHFLSVRYVQETEQTLGQKRIGFRFKDKFGLWQFDFFNEGAIERKAIQLLHKAGIEIPLHTSYDMNKRALEAIIFTLRDKGCEDAEHILDNALFGRGNVFPFIRLIEKVYESVGGFKALRKLSESHQDALRNGDESKILFEEQMIVDWCESLIKKEIKAA